MNTPQGLIVDCWLLIVVCCVFGGVMGPLNCPRKPFWSPTRTEGELGTIPYCSGIYVSTRSSNSNVLRLSELGRGSIMSYETVTPPYYPSIHLQALDLEKVGWYGWRKINWFSSGGEGWQLDNRACRADVRTHYCQGGEEFTSEKKLWIGIACAHSWRVSVLIHQVIACRLTLFIQITVSTAY